MDCKEAQRLIDGYVDGELDLVGSIAVEGHLEDCGACVRRLESRRALCGSLRSSALGFEPPRGLEARVLKAVRQESRSAALREQRALRRHLGWPAMAFASVVLLAVVGWGLYRSNPGSISGGNLVEDAISDHVRSLQVSHLFDVASTNQHTVKPWFNGKLDYAPPVVDLVDVGFPLTGGRLDYLGGRPVAALVYHRRLHVINLFVWPSASGASEAPGEPEVESERGYHTLRWSRGGMAFLAVSDVNVADMKEFARGLIDRAGR